MNHPRHVMIENTTITYRPGTTHVQIHFGCVLGGGVGGLFFVKVVFPERRIPHEWSRFVNDDRGIGLDHATGWWCSGGRGG
jgi:hypothetical protein